MTTTRNRLARQLLEVGLLMELPFLLGFGLHRLMQPWPSPRPGRQSAGVRMLLATFLGTPALAGGAKTACGPSLALRQGQRPFPSGFGPPSARRGLLSKPSGLLADFPLTMSRRGPVGCARAGRGCLD